MLFSLKLNLYYNLNILQKIQRDPKEFIILDAIMIKSS